MTPEVGAPYRFGLAERSLDSAQDNVTRGRWRDAALFARAAVENAAKAILACFGVVPHTHEPGQILLLATQSSQFPAELRNRAAALMPDLPAYGVREHVLLSCGDEEHGIDPWSLVTEERARGHVRMAETMVALARDCVRCEPLDTPWCCRAPATG